MSVLTICFMIFFCFPRRLPKNNKFYTCIQSLDNIFMTVYQSRDLNLSVNVFPRLLKNVETLSVRSQCVRSLEILVCKRDKIEMH